MFVMTLHNNHDTRVSCSYYTPTLTNSLCEASELHIRDTPKCSLRIDNYCNVKCYVQNSLTITWHHIVHIMKQILLAGKHVYNYVRLK